MDATRFGRGMEKFTHLGCGQTGIESEGERFMAQMSMHQALCTQQLNCIYFQFPALGRQFEVLWTNAQNLTGGQTGCLFEQVHGR